MRLICNARTALLVATTALAMCGGAAAPLSAAPAPEAQVVAISIDGLHTEAITRLGAEEAPALHRMMREGASTLNARTAVEQTETLPNHTGMVTGRRIDADRSGHGVTWNDARPNPRTVQQAAGHGVDSIFAMAHRQGLDSALYAAKEKFGLFQRSWPNGLDRVVITKRNGFNTRQARADITAGTYDFTFFHISLPDSAGHDHGWMSPEYLAAVRRSDRLVGTVLDDVESVRGRQVTVILTADHGGTPGSKRHIDASSLDNYRIPFMMWGSGVAAGNLYRMSPQLANPGKRRVGYNKARQPVRNGDLANVAAELLGIPVVRGSRLNSGSQLDWR